MPFIRTALRGAEARVVLFMAVQAGAASLFALLTARWLGPSSRGSVVVFMTTASFLMLVGSLGVSTGSRVLLNDSPPLNLNFYLRQARLMSAVHLVTSSSVGLFVLANTGGMPTLWVGVVFVPFAAIQLLNYFKIQALHGIGRHGTAVLGDVLASSLQIAAVVSLEVAGRLNLTNVCLVILGGSIAQTMFLAICLRSEKQSPPFADYSLGHLIKYSLPAVVSTLGQAVVIRGDRLILGIMAGAAPVGIYAVAATFTEMLWLVPAGVAQVAFRKASVRGLDRAGARARNLTLLVTALTGIALAACADLIVTTLLGAEYLGAVGLAYILIVASLPMSSFQLDVAVLNGLGRLSAGGRATTLGTAILVAGCLVTIPHFGAYGAAWSSVAAYTAMAVSVRLNVRKETTQD